MAPRPLRVLHVITGLEPGGAERFLERLVLASDARRARHRIVSLKPPGAVGQSLKLAGVPVRTLDAESPAAALRLIPQLHREIRHTSPDVVQGWLHHGDLAATLAAGERPLAWNLRASHFDEGHKMTTRAVARACAALSDRPHAIVCCSEAARQSHLELGYRGERMRVIENGFDAGRFLPDDEVRATVRRELEVENDTFVVGALARHDPMKDLPTLLDAFRSLDVDGAVLVVAGRGTRDLLGEVRERGLDGRVRLLGARPDPERLLCAFDALALTSRSGEGLPNAVVEALLSGVPVVATDVGDTRRAAGPRSAVVPPGDADAVARALEALAALAPEARRTRAEEDRAWAKAEFDLPKSVELYTSLWEELAGR